MSRVVDLVFVAALVLGIFLFLYGANYFDNIIGWTGVYLFGGAILLRLVLYIYGKVTKKNPAQNS
jgi:hypothetical protein